MEEGKNRKENRKLILEGNSFYEIDLDCMREKERRKQTQTDNRKKGQRG